MPAIKPVSYQLLVKVFERDGFTREWQIQNKELNAGPDVDFEFSGTTMLAVVHSSGPTKWSDENFRSALQLVLHRIDPACDIVTLQE